MSEPVIPERECPGKCDYCDTQHVDWETFAEGALLRAEAKVAELIREREDLNRKHDIAWSNWKTSAAKVAELEAAYRQATEMAASYARQVAEQATTIANAQDAAKFANNMFLAMQEKYFEAESRIAEISAAKLNMCEEAQAHAREQAATIERLTKCLETMPICGWCHTAAIMRDAALSKQDKCHE